MDSNYRIIINTFILYIKIFVVMILSLWTVPLVLKSLGQSDYGLYNLVAGVVTMLSFLNASMIVVTQRYMSVTMGENDNLKLNMVFNSAIRIHIILAVIVVAILEAFSLFIFDDFLNINYDRIFAAKIIYQVLIFSTFISIITVPFDATMNAYENMIAFSLIEIIDSLIKLLLAFSLSHITTDLLIYYGIGLALVTLISNTIKVILVKSKYKAVFVNFRLPLDKLLFKDMLLFASWNTMGSIAMIGKNQGIAIVLNLFKGTAINAAYGIANQINGFTSTFTLNIQKAISPQLMRKEGANNRDSMILMSFSLVKITSLIFGLMSIPLIIEINQVLKLWLNDSAPEYTAIFCQLILLTQLLFQFSAGVALVIDAVGKIGFYRVVLSVVLIMNIPLGYFFLKLGYPPYYVLISMFFIEACCLVVRLWFARNNCGFPISTYMKKCLFPSSIVLVSSFSTGFLLTLLMEDSIVRLVLVILVTTAITLIGSYVFTFSKKEKQLVRLFANSLKINK